MATQSITTSLIHTQAKSEAGPAETSASRVARLGDRFLGLLIDTLPLAALSALLASGFASSRGRVFAGFTVPGAPAWLPYVCFFIVSLIYFSVLEGTCGRTMGKALVGIKVRRTNGEQCDMRASLIRNLFRLIDGCGVYLIAFLVASFSRSRQRLGDHLADTLVEEQDLPTRWRFVITVLWTALTTATIYAAYILHIRVNG